MVFACRKIVNVTWLGTAQPWACQAWFASMETVVHAEAAMGTIVVALYPEAEKVGFAVVLEKMYHSSWAPSVTIIPRTARVPVLVATGSNMERFTVVALRRIFWEIIIFSRLIAGVE